MLRLRSQAQIKAIGALNSDAEAFDTSAAPLINFNKKARPRGIDPVCAPHLSYPPLLFVLPVLLEEVRLALLLGLGMDRGVRRTRAGSENVRGMPTQQTSSPMASAGHDTVASQPTSVGRYNTTQSLAAKRGGRHATQSI